jgi:hypothetical protein
MVAPRPRAASVALRQDPRRHNLGRPVAARRCAIAPPTGAAMIAAETERRIAVEIAAEIG